MKGKQYLWLKIGGNGVGSPPYAYVGGELIQISDIDEDTFCFFDIQFAVVGNKCPVHGCTTAIHHRSQEDLFN